MRKEIAILNAAAALSAQVADHWPQDLRRHPLNLCLPRLQRPCGCYY